MYDVIGWILIVTAAYIVYQWRWPKHSNPIWAELQAMAAGIAVAMGFIWFR